MPTESFLTGPSSSRSMLQRICIYGTGMVGFVLLLYAIYFVPNTLSDSVSQVMGFLVFLAILGLLSVIGAIGYWMNKTWGWYIHLFSTLGQLFLPGSLFEFKLDLYHMIGWASPVVSLIIVVVMGINIRRKKRSSHSQGQP